MKASARRWCVVSIIGISCAVQEVCGDVRVGAGYLSLVQILDLTGRCASSDSLRETPTLHDRRER